MCDIWSVVCSLYYIQRTGKLLSSLLSMPIIKDKLPQNEGYSSCCRPIMRAQKSWALLWSTCSLHTCSVPITHTHTASLEPVSDSQVQKNKQPVINKIRDVHQWLWFWQYDKGPVDLKVWKQIGNFRCLGELRQSHVDCPHTYNFAGFVYTIDSFNEMTAERHFTWKQKKKKTP